MLKTFKSRVLGSNLFLGVSISVMTLWSASAQAAFQHPGIVVNLKQLNYMKSQVAAHAEPFYSAYLKASGSIYGQQHYKPAGPPSGGVIECGPGSRPDNGCSTAKQDGIAAYTQALLYWVTGNKVYAQDAIAILNAYSHVKAYTNTNAPLQAAWDGEKLIRAAEIIRAANVGWSSADISAFSNMIKNAILPKIYAGSSANGNWELSMIDAMLAAAVFTENTSLFDHAVTMWHQRVPAYFYNYNIDGNHHVPLPRGASSTTWYGQTVFNSSTSGISQETCRDLGHVQYGMAAAINAAETATIQGVDLYKSERQRLETGIEFLAYYLQGHSIPSYICGGNVNIIGTYNTFEIAYNSFHNRMGDILPNTHSLLVNTVRKSKGFSGWTISANEGLTHGGNPP